jgi:Transposase zinc-ribbon domain
MSQYFLLSSAARTLSLTRIMRMTDDTARNTFKRIRWAATGGEPFCPHCGCLTVYTGVSYSYAVRDQNRMVYQRDEDFIASLPSELRGPMLRWFERFQLTLNDDCVSASGRDRTHKPAQDADSACLFDLRAGSQSAPIGTPPSADSKRRIKQID